MNIIATITATIIIIAGAIFNQLNRDGTQQEQIVDGQASQSAVPAQPTQQPEPETTSSATITIKPDAAEPTQVNEENGLYLWRYPNSQVINEDSHTLFLESNINDDEITSWYKDKIRNLGMNVKSFVQTRINGKVLNKLVSASQDQEINVEISKEEENSVVNIMVTISIYDNAQN